MTDAEIKKRGRVSTFNPEIADKLCLEVSEGKTLAVACREIGIARSTVATWYVDNQGGFADNYARARESQAECWSDDILAISDDSSRDTITKIGRNGEEIAIQDTEWLARSRLKVDTRKWLMAKLHPRKYGEKIEVDQKVTVEAGESILALLSNVRAEREALPVQPVIEIGDAKPAESEEW